MLFIVQGLWKMRMETTTAMTPLPLPRTCSVSALVYRVTRKLVRLTCCCARETGTSGWLPGMDGTLLQVQPAARRCRARAPLRSIHTREGQGHALRRNGWHLHQSNYRF